MSSYTCCEIIECNDICNITNYCCVDKLCGESVCIRVCLNGNETICVQISKNKLDHLIKQIDCGTHKHKYKIIYAIILNKSIYIFIQLGYNTKQNKLCVIKGEFNNVNNQILNDTLTLHMQYNVYLAGKGENICTNESVKLKISYITYSKFNDSFIILISSHHKTFIGIINYFPSLETLGVDLGFVHLKSKCHVLALKHRALCITPCNQYKYKIVVYNNKMKCNQVFVLCFE